MNELWRQKGTASLYCCCHSAEFDFCFLNWKTSHGSGQMRIWRRGSEWDTRGAFRGLRNVSVLLLRGKKKKSIPGHSLARVAVCTSSNGSLAMQQIEGEEKVEVGMAAVQPQTIHMRDAVNHITAKELNTSRRMFIRGALTSANLFVCDKCHVNILIWKRSLKC